MTEEEYTTIRVRKSTVTLINDNRKGSETQDEFVRRLVEKYISEQGP
jgi:hypothetical protein